MDKKSRMVSAPAPNGFNAKIYDAARSHELAVHILSKHDRQAIAEAEFGQKTVLTFFAQVPAVALGLELFIKSSLEVDFEPRRGHDLHYLFHLLPSSLQGEVCRLCRRTPEEIDGFLDRGRNTFQEWRYFYEHEHLPVNLEALKSISEALHQAIQLKNKLSE